MTEHKHEFVTRYRYDDFEGKGRPSFEIRQCKCGKEVRVVEQAVDPAETGAGN